MNIPDYRETLCIYCKLKDKCNKYEVKEQDNLKYSYCKNYAYIGGNDEENT